MLKEFKPTIFFLLRFVLVYLTCNFLYGLWITSYDPNPDPVTRLVSRQSSAIINIFDRHTEIADSPRKATVYIQEGARAVLGVYEGCNGINVMIVFVSFLLAFGPFRIELAWFIPLGLLIIHITNLARIVLLFFVSIKLPRYFYVTHKYFFTASIYVIVFVIWIWWVRRYTQKHK